MPRYTEEQMEEMLRELEEITGTTNIDSDVESQYLDNLFVTDTSTTTAPSPTYSFTSTTSSEPERFGRNLNEEERRALFPMKFGVEMEFEANGTETYEEIEDMINLSDCWGVKSDGSLTDAGFEVISAPLDCYANLYNFMEAVYLALRSKMSLYEDVSPVAIHFHVSNVLRPTNLFYVVQYFGDVFEHLRTRNENHLVHNRMGRPKYRIGKETIESSRINYSRLNKRYMDGEIDRGIDPTFREESSRISQHFMRGRRSTLRWAGFDSENSTIEFRIFPHRYNPKTYKRYIKIMAGMIKYSEENDFLTVYRMTKRKSPLYVKLKEFMKMSELDENDMLRMFRGVQSSKKFEHKCMCESPLTRLKLDELSLWRQPGDFISPEVRISEENSIYGRFRNFNPTSFVSGTVTIELMNNGRMWSRQGMRINDRDMQMAALHQDEWFLVGEPPENPICPTCPTYIPRCMTLGRSRNAGHSLASFSVSFSLDNESYDRVVVSRDTFRDVEFMWNESMQWCHSSDGRDRISRMAMSNSNDSL